MQQNFGSLNRFKRSIKLVDLSKLLTVDIDTIDCYQL